MAATVEQAAERASEMREVALLWGAGGTVEGLGLFC
jgi:hypothetical protein